MKICDECSRCFEDDVDRCVDMHGPLAGSREGSISMVPGYRLDRRIGSGLRGDTFRATRSDCGRSCIVRIVAADKAARAPFLAEAKIAADLFHPNLAAIYESGTCASGDLFVVSEDTSDCETLRDKLEHSGPPPLLDAVHIVRIIAETLDDLHHSGLIHRSLSPENVLVSTDPSGAVNVRLQDIDFGGVAQSSIISNRFLIDTETAAIRYFAPEQCSGEPASARADVYSLGILLYELIAGTPPFDADRAAGIIEQHRHSHPPEIKINNFDLRMLISHTLTESLNKQADFRQSSADLFARQLRHIEQLATHASTPAPALSTAQQPTAAKRQPRLITLAESEVDIPSADELAGVIGSAVELRDCVVTDNPTGPNTWELNPTRPSREESTIDPDNIRPIDFRAVRQTIPELLAKASAPSVLREPRVIQWNEPLDDIPSVEETLDVLRSEGDVAAFDPIDVSVEPIPEHAIDDSTWITDAADRGASEPSRLLHGPEMETVDEILSVKSIETPHVPASEMFASVHTISAVHFGKLRKAIGVGAVAALLVLAFVFRSDIADAVTPFDLGKLHPAPSRANAEPLPVAADVKPDTTEPELPAVRDELSELTIEDPPAGVTVDNSAIRRAIKSTERDDVKATTKSRSITPAPTRNRPAPIQPSTIVITYADPRKKRAERSNDRDPFAAPKSASGQTRPRIVPNPKP